MPDQPLLRAKALKAARKALEAARDYHAVIQSEPRGADDSLLMNAYGALNSAIVTVHRLEGRI